jgi:hypothetical protein
MSTVLRLPLQLVFLVTRIKTLSLCHYEAYTTNTQYTVH